jgi:hypothetical protein
MVARTQEVTVTGSFKVTVDDSKFTQAFFEEFSTYMFPVDCVQDCIDHLSLMFARGVIDGSTKFIEGYGDPADFGIKFEVGNGASAWVDADVQVVDFTLEPI